MRYQGREQSKNVEDRRGQRGGGNMRKIGGGIGIGTVLLLVLTCLLYTSPSPRDRTRSRMPSSA